MKGEKVGQRKIIPIAAVISAGKSKFLNVICNFNFLECKSGIATKFVNIIRYNPAISEPKFYHLKLIKEKDQYIFYKDTSFEEKIGDKAIIEENIKINKKLESEIKINYEEIFYMTEINKVSSILNEKLLLTHDLCDIPGLSEYQPDDDKKKEDKKPDKQSDDEKDIIMKGEEFGLIHEEKNKNELKENNNDDDVYENVEIKNNTYLSEIFGILKPYIERGIIVLSVENYNHVTNFEIIAKLHKVLNKRIKNFLVILNKMDLSTNREEDIKKCIGLFFQKFTNTKIFNIKLD